jgi:hypothetical protein
MRKQAGTTALILLALAAGCARGNLSQSTVPLAAVRKPPQVLCTVTSQNTHCRQGPTLRTETTANKIGKFVSPL